MSNNIEGTVVVITGACTGLAKRSPVSFGTESQANPMKRFYIKRLRLTGGERS